MLLLNKPVISEPEYILAVEYKALTRFMLKQWRHYKKPVKVLSLIFILGSYSGFCRGQADNSLSPPGKETLTISLQGNRLSIWANQVSWQELLAKLRVETHIPIYANPLSSKVSVSIPPLPISEALRQLFSHRFDYVLLYSRFDKQWEKMPKAVWLLNGSGENSTQVGLGGIRSNEKISIGSHDSGSAENSAGEIDRTQMVHELIQQAQNEKNPILRIKAISTLSKSEFDDTATEEALKTALNDDDPSVREYAVQAIAEKEGVQAAEILKQALEDPDEAVRVKAAQSLPPQGQDLAL